MKIWGMYLIFTAPADREYRNLFLRHFMNSFYAIRVICDHSDIKVNGKFTIRYEKNIIGDTWWAMCILMHVIVVKAPREEQPINVDTTYYYFGRLIRWDMSHWIFCDQSGRYKTDQSPTATIKLLSEVNKSLPTSSRLQLPFHSGLWKLSQYNVSLDMTNNCTRIVSSFIENICSFFVTECMTTAVTYTD